MARKSVGLKGKQSKPSSSRGPTNHSKVAQVSWMVELWFKHLSTEKEMKHVVVIEEVVRCQHQLTSDVEIAREV
jgi:hypothetical protein